MYEQCLRIVVCEPLYSMVYKEIEKINAKVMIYKSSGYSSALSMASTLSVVAARNYTFAMIFLILPKYNKDDHEDEDDNEANKQKAINFAYDYVCLNPKDIIEIVTEDELLGIGIDEIIQKINDFYNKSVYNNGSPRM